MFYILGLGCGSVYAMVLAGVFGTKIAFRGSATVECVMHVELVSASTHNLTSVANTF